MPRYVALLRGINVGGHRVKMDELRRHFAALKFTNVATFIASGNVLFDMASTDVAALETRIEQKLAGALGYAVPTLLRTLSELAVIGDRRAFAEADMAAPEFSQYVIFLRDAPERAVVAGLPALNSKFDEFRVHDREIHWLCRGKISQVSLAWELFGKLMAKTKTAATSRNLTTVRQIAALDAPAAPAHTLNRGPPPRAKT